jgi:NAD(P)-dependent dehydrogenase (short-subunit alcohol dehydrogenase family)
MATQWSDLKGKTAFITGGTSGIGKATVIELARQGANVVFTGRREPEGIKVAQEAGAAAKAAGTSNITIKFIQGDVTDEKHLQHAVSVAQAITGRLDAAFNNAGVEHGGTPITESTREQYTKVFDINVLGVMLSMKYELAAMLKNAGGPSGSVVNTSSIAGSIGMANTGIYIASKHAVNGLTKSAALEVAKSNIRVNTVSPGGVDTAMLDRFTGNKHPDAMTWMNSMHPVGRIGTVQEITDPVLFLFSDASKFITGADIVIDGGFTAQ